MLLNRCSSTPHRFNFVASHKGVTLVEVMISLFLAALLALAVIQTLVHSEFSSDRVNKRLSAIYAIEREVSRLRTLPFNQLLQDDFYINGATNPLIFDQNGLRRTQENINAGIYETDFIFIYLDVDPTKVVTGSSGKITEVSVSLRASYADGTEGIAFSDILFTRGGLNDILN